MNFYEFMSMYDNWNGETVVNDDNLSPIVAGNTCYIMENRKDLYDKNVVAFGFYDDELFVRVK